MRFTGDVAKATILSLFLAFSQNSTGVAQTRPSAPAVRSQHQSFTSLWNSSVNKRNLEKTASGKIYAGFIGSFYAEMDRQGEPGTVQGLINSVQQASENAVRKNFQACVAGGSFPMPTLTRFGQNIFVEGQEVYIDRNINPKAGQNTNTLLKSNGSGLRVRVQFKRAAMIEHNGQIVPNITDQVLYTYDLLTLVNENQSGAINPNASVKRTERDFDLQ